MKKILTAVLGGILILTGCSRPAPTQISSPDEKLTVNIRQIGDKTCYNIIFDNDTVLKNSLLGLKTDIGNFTDSLKFLSSTTSKVIDSYTLYQAKQSQFNYDANRLVNTYLNGKNDTLQVIFQVSNNNIAMRYRIASLDKKRCEIYSEATGFLFPDSTRTIITPQTVGHTGWNYDQPSYEQEYTYLEPAKTPSKYGQGYTFPALFQENGKTWLLISETGVDSNYVGSHLSDCDSTGEYHIAFPQMTENAGQGTNTVITSLPLLTSWKTITVGETLKPIAETTVMYDVVKPKYAADTTYKPGRSTWSWIVWQDPSCNYNDQKTFIDLAADMHYEYILIDAYWDTNIGYDGIEKLIKYANSKGVDVVLWYNSNGNWNTAPLSPIGCMNTDTARATEMAWLEKVGVKGIKVDFFGGDKQTTIKLYEDILTDANKHHLWCNFHGATIPRGWERMFPNFMESEATLASENLIFSQAMADNEAFRATIIPFTRNAIGSCDYGPVIFNRGFGKGDKGNIRKTTDAYQLATSVLYQAPVQHFGLVPKNLKEQPDYVINFMQNVPTTWDEMRYIAGTPGKDCVLARRHGEKWYITAINGENKPKDITIKLEMFKDDTPLVQYFDKDNRTCGMDTISVNDQQEITIHMLGNGGALLMN